MTTELAGQAQAVDEHAEEETAVYETALPAGYAHLTERLGQAVLRATGLVGVNLRHLCAWLLVPPGRTVEDITLWSDSELDKEVKVCVGILQRDTRGGAERLAKEVL